MFDLFEPDFSSPKTRKLISSHNAAVCELENIRAETEREAAALAAADPFSIDPEALETRSAKIRRGRHDATKKEISLLQERIELCGLLQAERTAAYQAASEALTRVRMETRAGLAQLGFGDWLTCPDAIVQGEISRILDFASPCKAAIARVQEVRDFGMSLSQESGDSKWRLDSLTEKFARRLPRPRPCLLFETLCRRWLRRWVGRPGRAGVIHRQACHRPGHFESGTMASKSNSARRSVVKRAARAPGRCQSCGGSLPCLPCRRRRKAGKVSTPAAIVQRRQKSPLV